MFPLNTVTGITFNRQVGTDLSNPKSFTEVPVPIAALRLIPGVVDKIAFGKYLSPDYETAGKFIPPVETLSGTPVVQGRNEVFFNLFLPSGPKPAGGWPVAIFGHGFRDNKNGGPFFLASTMAANGIATIAINVVGHGGGPLSTLTVSQAGGGSVTFPSGGRGIDQNDNGVIGPEEGVNAAPPRGIITSRDGLRQTVVDLVQLVQVIKVGMDADSDGVRDLDPSRIYYFGISLGGIYGTIFLAVEPNVRVGVPNVPGSPTVEVARLSPTFRPILELAFALWRPPLTNVGDIRAGDFRFNENLPLRNQPPVINDVPGAIKIQEVIENLEWVNQSGSPVAYAPHLREKPLAGVPAKSIIIQFARGDQNVPNPTTTAILRAGDLADRATFYRHDLAFNDPNRNPTGKEVPKNPHNFIAFNLISPAVADIGLGAQRQIGVFFASDGTLVIDPDGPGPLFEVPIVPPLPEDLGFIP